MVQLRVDLTAIQHNPNIINELAAWSLESNDQAPFTIGYESQYWIKDTQGRKLEIDFDGNKKDYCRTHKGSGEPLARALGYKEGIRSVIDLTAGLGIDAVFLAQIGFDVLAIERNPIMAFLLSKAKERSRREELKRVHFVFGDSKEVLNNLKFDKPISAYFDPMYPEKKKSALPRQEMVIFRDMVGGDLDSIGLLEIVLSKPFHKVVVKRPVKAPAVIERPGYELTSKLVRYDVYLPRSLS